MIVGITGGTGCGKTTALNAIRELGGLVIDCDALYHQLLKTDPQLLDAIRIRFPGTVSAGVLDRKKLGAQVFSSPTALEDLNAITHPAIIRKVKELLRPAPALGAIDAIRLFESGLNTLCDITVAVTAPEDIRVKRLMLRDGIDASYALQRISAQNPQSFFRENCDYELRNDGTECEFRSKCLAFFHSIDIIKEEIQAKENPI